MTPRPWPRCVALLAVALVLAIGPAARAHAADFAGWSLRGGVANSGFGGSLHGALGDRRTAFAGGVAAQIGLGSTISLQPELWWISKGGETGAIVIGTGSGAATFVGPEWIVDYVELPLLARFDVAGEVLVRPYVVAGPGLAFRVGGSVRSSSVLAASGSPRLQRARIFEGISSADAVDHFKRFDLDAIVGLGFALGRGDTHVLLEARWQEGLLDVRPEGSEFDARNRSLVVIVGFERR